MKPSLEIACEDFFISLFRADERLNGLSFFHFDDEQKAKSNAIVVQAKEGNKNLAAFGGYDVEMTVEYRTIGNTPKARNDLISSALHGIVYDNTLSGDARRDMAIAAGLSDLLIKDEATSDRQNTSDLRKRMLTFPLQAKLA